MDAGIGVGGLSTGKDEYASSCFDLFSYPEIEMALRELARKHSDLFLQQQVKVPLLLIYLQILISSRMQNLFVFMVLCE